MPDLIDILACPLCKADLTLFDTGRWLVCQSCGVQFPIRESVPCLLAEDAEHFGNCESCGTSP